MRLVSRSTPVFCFMRFSVFLTPSSVLQGNLLRANNALPALWEGGLLGRQGRVKVAMGTTEKK